jgi:hypothetical protein
MEHVSLTAAVPDAARLHYIRRLDAPGRGI